MGFRSQSVKSPMRAQAPLGGKKVAVRLPIRTTPSTLSQVGLKLFQVGVEEEEFLLRKRLLFLFGRPGEVKGEEDEGA